MSVTCTLHHMTKKLNSTKQPTGGTVVDCNFRNGTGQDNPRLELRNIHSNANYMYVPSFNRYYYITDREYDAERRVWVFSGSCDVLASFRDEILSSTQFVTRCSDRNFYDETVTDGLALPLNRSLRYSQYIDGTGIIPYFTTNEMDMTVICNCVGTGFVILDMRNYNRLIQAFFEQHPITNSEFWIQDMAKMMVNPSEQFLSQMAMPIDINSDIAIGNITPHVGWWRIDNVTGHYLKRTYQKFSATLPVPYNPASQNRNLSYLNYPPYASFSAYIGGFGLIPLDSSKIFAGENLTYEVTIDYQTGGAQIRIINENTQVVGYSTAQMGFNMVMYQRSPANVVSAISSIVQGGIVGGAGGAAMSAVNSLPGLLSGNLSVQGSTGGVGSWVDFAHNSRLICEYKTVKNVANYRCGSPVYRDIALNGIASGSYVECMTGRINGTGTEAEMQKIQDYLKGGVYLD